MTVAGRKYLLVCQSWATKDILSYRFDYGEGMLGSQYASKKASFDHGENFMYIYMISPAWT